MTVRLTVKLVEFPAYVCWGFWEVELWPSPKFHDHETILPSLSEELSENVTVRSAEFAVKAAWGSWLTVTSLVTLPDNPMSSVTVSATLYFPLEAYV